jgi:protein TonB
LALLAIGLLLAIELAIVSVVFGRFVSTWPEKIRAWDKSVTRAAQAAQGETMPPPVTLPPKRTADPVDAPPPSEPTPATPATAMGNPGDWFSPDFYPPDAKQAGIGGRVVVRLHVDRKGQADGCTLLDSSGSPSLDSATCALAIRNARYRPALDAQGQPVASDVLLPAVRWEIRD